MTHADQLPTAAGHAVLDAVQAYHEAHPNEAYAELIPRALDAIAHYTIQLAAERQAANLKGKPNH